MRQYRNCRGQIWCVHWFPSWKVCFGANSIAVQSWEVCELEFDFFDFGSLFIYSYGDFSKWPVRPYKNCTGQIWYVHWFPSQKVCFGPNSIAVQSWEVCVLKIGFFQWRSCVSYREFFKVPCAAVHKLYRSNLVCPLIPILKGVFWSKQHSCTVLGSMLTENWVFSMEILY